VKVEKVKCSEMACSAPEMAWSALTGHLRGCFRVSVSICLSHYVKWLTSYVNILTKNSDFGK